MLQVKYKCEFQSGVMHLAGPGGENPRDYLFSKAAGVLEWS